MIQIDILLLWVGILFYTLSWFVFTVQIWKGTEPFIQKITTTFLWVGWFFHLSSFLTRLILYGYIPVVTLYETASFISLVAMAIILLLKRKCKIDRILYAILLIIIIENILILVMSSKKSSSQVFHNLWLMVHVPFGLISYSLFLISLIFAILYLVKWMKNSKDSHRLDLYYRLSFRSIQNGLILLSICIVTGSIWAHYAWGFFWGWDPKETWSLITWVVYILSLVFYYCNKKARWVNIVISILGFLLVIFTYLGVNFLVVGLHSYV